MRPKVLVVAGVTLTVLLLIGVGLRQAGVLVLLEKFSENHYIILLGLATILFVGWKFLRSKPAFRGVGLLWPLGWCALVFGLYGLGYASGAHALMRILFSW